MDDIAIQRRSGACVLEINRPGRANALRRQTIRRLAEALGDTEEQAAADSSLRGVVITGGGGRFSAGADLAELEGTAADTGFDRELASLTAAIERCPLPVVAAVEGACVGAGVDLAWSCDAVVVARAARVWLPAARLGILYNPAALARLHARLGAMPLRRLVLLGDQLSGADLAAAGAAVPADEGHAVAVAVGIIDRAPGASPAVAAAKALLASLDAGSFEASAWEERRRALADSPERRRLLLDHRNSLEGLTEG